MKAWPSPELLRSSQPVLAIYQAGADYFDLMLIWLLAAAMGAVLSFTQYRLGGERRPIPLVLLRGAALAIVLALLLDAPGGPARAVRAYLALDASQSWRASGENGLWGRAVRIVDSIGSDTLLLVGDSVRAGLPPAVPNDRATRVAPLVLRALGAGRPVTIVTDGRVDDPDRLDDLPAGSKIVQLSSAAVRDGAIASLDAPNMVAAGDTVQFTVVLIAGGAGAGAGRLELSLGGSALVSAAVDSFAPFAEREVRLRAVVGGAPGARLLRALLRTSGDLVARNDTLLAVLEVARGAAAVFVSTAPDYDARYALDVLRGTLAVPTRGFFQVAPGQWRVEGALSSVSEAEVRRSLAAAPLAVLHGDTAIFGAPRALTKGALALVVPPPQHGEDYYVTGSAPSPLSLALSGIPWDSLPPLELGVSPLDAQWVGVSARRLRQFDERALVSGASVPRRIAIVPAVGLWRWRFQGGRSAEAFTAFWGSIFDWLTGDANDLRAARPSNPWARAGDPVVWRRGSSRDSVVTVVLRLQGAGTMDTVTLRFHAESGIATSPPLPEGLYDTETKGGRGLLAVNPSVEWLPRRPSVQSGTIGTAPHADRASRARLVWWWYALAMLALCTEWVLRRRAGLR